MKLTDLTGKRFGRLVVVAMVGPYKRGHSMWWFVRCDCGKEKVVSGAKLTSGRTTSCGCYAKESLYKANVTHGDAFVGRVKRLYKIWLNMKARTSNPKTRSYPLYGGRGIKVCGEWWNRYESFRDWAKSTGYNDSLSIDRIDNDGNYEPSNCRWASNKEQCRNRRSNRLLTIGGETQTMIEWSIKRGINYKKVHSRLKAGWAPERALELEAA